MNSSLRISLYFFFSIFLTINHSVEAKAKKLVATVVKMRGTVTQLAPGESRSRVVSMGDRIKEDTSLLTMEKSFVQIRFDDGSTVNLGPASKIVVQKMDADGNGIINLLKGRSRYNVTKKIEGDKRFYIRTKTSAIGVRGTEFETIYNPENDVTSLLTYSGKVAMARADDRPIKKTIQQVEVERTQDNEVILNEGPKVELINEEAMEHLLKEDSVEIKKGQFAQNVQKIDTISKPVKISPIQLNALYKNPEFEAKPEFKIKKSVVNPEGQELLITGEDQDVPAEGVFDRERKIYAPKAGGFIDRDTGLYIPPTQDALFDQKNKIYYSENIGSIDQETGQYEPPIGLKLDSKKGFVKRQFKKGTPQEFLAKVEKNQAQLNSVIATDVIIGEGEEKTDSDSFRALTNRELISKNLFTLSFHPYGESIDHKGDGYLGGNRSFDSGSARDLTLGLSYASGSKWQPFTSFTFRNYRIPNRGTLNMVGNQLNSLTAGIKYSLDSRYNIVAQTSLDQQYFLHHSNNGTTTTSTFERISSPNFYAGVEGALIRSGRFSTQVGLLLGTNLSKTTGDQELESFGFRMKYFVKADYWLHKRLIFSLGLNGHIQNDTVRGTSQIYSADVSRSGLGLISSLGTFF